MNLSLGISTCPNDTFIYEHLIGGLKNSPFKWNVQFADVQTLNEMVMDGKLDVAKVSAQIYPYIQSNYEYLHCGGAIGYGCGPLLLSSGKEKFDPQEKTTLPGKNTTAALLFKFWFQKKYGSDFINFGDKINYGLFNEVYQNLLNKKIKQGVTIHEHRFTWKEDGLYLLQDLGQFWEEKMKSPIPLGIAVVRRSFSPEIQNQIESEIRESLNLAWNRKEIITPFIFEKAQIMNKNVVESHIKMFVNDFSYSINEAGEKALENLWKLVNC